MMPSATVVSRHYLGDFPAFEIPAYSLVHWTELFAYAGLGIMAGLVALAFIRSLYAAEDSFDRLKLPLPVNSTVQPFVGAGPTLVLAFPHAVAPARHAETEASAESWERVLGVNLMGFVHCAKAAIVAMLGSGGGVVVNLASVRSLVAGPKCVQYDTAKAAILGLTRSMARDHAADNVRVMAVGPGPIYTDFHEGRARQLGQTAEQYRESFGADTMLKRPGTPEEVANAILFLASDEASFMTGTCVFVDGGQTGL